MHGHDSRGHQHSEVELKQGSAIGQSDPHGSSSSTTSTIIMLSDEEMARKLHEELNCGPKVVTTRRSAKQPLPENGRSTESRTKQDVLSVERTPTSIVSPTATVSKSLSGNISHPATAVSASHRLEQSQARGGITLASGNSNIPCTTDLHHKPSAVQVIDSNGSLHAGSSLLTKGNIQVAALAKSVSGCSSHTLAHVSTRQPLSIDPASDIDLLGSLHPGTGADRKRSWATRELQGLSVVSAVEGGSPRASRGPSKGPTTSAPLSASAAAATPAVAGIHGSTANSQPMQGCTPTPVTFTATASIGQQHGSVTLTPHMAMRSSSRSSKEVHTGSSIEGNSAAATHKTIVEELLTAAQTGRKHQQQGVSPVLTAAASDPVLHQHTHGKQNGLHARQNGLHASDADPSSEADDDDPTLDPAAVRPSYRHHASRGLTSPPLLSESLLQGGSTDGGGPQGGGDENSLYGNGERGGGALRSKITKLPMVRSGKKWYRARLMKEERDRVLLESSCKGSEGAQPFWLPRDSDRIWHGSYKGRDWKYLGDGAWEPKAGALLALNKRVKAHLARGASGPTTTAAAPSHSRGAAQPSGVRGASSQRLATLGNNDRGEWLCSGSVSPSGASEDAAAVEEDGEMIEEEGAAAAEEDQDAVMCDVWPNQDAELDERLVGHGYSTSQEVTAMVKEEPTLPRKAAMAPQLPVTRAALSPKRSPQKPSIPQKSSPQKPPLHKPPSHSHALHPPTTNSSSAHDQKTRTSKPDLHATASPSSPASLMTPAMASHATTAHTLAPAAPAHLSSSLQQHNGLKAEQASPAATATTPNQLVSAPAGSPVSAASIRKAAAAAAAAKPTTPIAPPEAVPSPHGAAPASAGKAQPSAQHTPLTTPLSKLDSKASPHATSSSLCIPAETAGANANSIPIPVPISCESQEEHGASQQSLPTPMPSASRATDPLDPTHKLSTGGGPPLHSAPHPPTSLPTSPCSKPVASIPEDKVSTLPSFPSPGRPPISRLPHHKSAAVSAAAATTSTAVTSTPSSPAKPSKSMSSPSLAFSASSESKPDVQHSVAPAEAAAPAKSTSSTAAAASSKDQPSNHAPSIPRTTSLPSPVITTSHTRLGGSTASVATDLKSPAASGGRVGLPALSAAASTAAAGGAAFPRPQTPAAAAASTGASLLKAEFVPGASVPEAGAARSRRKGKPTRARGEGESPSPEMTSMDQVPSLPTRLSGDSNASGAAAAVAEQVEEEVKPLHNSHSAGEATLSAAAEAAVAGQLGWKGGWKGAWKKAAKDQGAGSNPVPAANAHTSHSAGQVSTHASHLQRPDHQQPHGGSRAPRQQQPRVPSPASLQAEAVNASGGAVAATLPLSLHGSHSDEDYEPSPAPRGTGAWARKRASLASSIAAEAAATSERPSRKQRLTHTGHDQSPQGNSPGREDVDDFESAGNELPWNEMPPVAAAAAPTLRPWTHNSPQHTAAASASQQEQAAVRSSSQVQAAPIHRANPTSPPIQQGPGAPRPPLARSNSNLAGSLPVSSSKAPGSGDAGSRGISAFAALAAAQQAAQPHGGPASLQAQRARRPVRLPLQSSGSLGNADPRLQLQGQHQQRPPVYPHDPSDATGNPSADTPYHSWGSGTGSDGVQDHHQQQQRHSSGYRVIESRTGSGPHQQRHEQQHHQGHDDHHQQQHQPQQHHHSNGPSSSRNQRQGLQKGGSGSMLPPSTSSQARRRATSPLPTYTPLDPSFQGLLDAVGDMAQDPKQPAMAQMGPRAKTQVDAFTQAALLASPPPPTPTGNHHHNSNSFGASPRGSNGEASPGGKARGSATSLQHEVILGLMDGSVMNGVSSGDGRRRSGSGGAAGMSSSKALLESLGGVGGRVISLLPSIDSVQHMMLSRTPSAGVQGAGSSQQQQLSLMGMQPMQSPQSMPLFCFPTST